MRFLLICCTTSHIKYYLFILYQLKWTTNMVSKHNHYFIQYNNISIIANLIKHKVISIRTYVLLFTCFKKYVQTILKLSIPNPRTAKYINVHTNTIKPHTNETNI